MNLQTMLNTVKDNLGNRASGRIGSRDVDTVVLEAINLAVPHCTQEAQPDYYNRVALLNLVLGQREYDLPTVDTDGETIKIKDIYSHRLVREQGATEVHIQRLNYSEFVRRTPNFSIEYTGTPSYYSLWGKKNKVYFDYFPSELFTMTLYVKVYPKVLTISDYNLELPIEEQWQIAIEAYATKHCYLKLQQTEMYAVWQDLYDREKVSISRDVNEKHSEGIDAGDRRMEITDPVLDPRARTWN